MPAQRAIVGRASRSEAVPYLPRWRVAPGVRPWIPWPRETVWVSGAFELLGAAGLLWRPTRRAAGIGLFLLTLAVTPANVYMLQRADLFANVPHWALVARLPVQVALLALIAWSTARPKPANG
jgi:uncharacterized membrane protein